MCIGYLQSGAELRTQRAGTAKKGGRLLPIVRRRSPNPIPPHMGVRQNMKSVKKKEKKSLCPFSLSVGLMCNTCNGGGLALEADRYQLRKKALARVEIGHLSVDKRHITSCEGSSTRQRPCERQTTPKK